MKKMSVKLSTVILITVLILVGCNMEHPHMNNGEKENQHSNAHGDHAHMNHSSSGEVPKNLKVAENPTFKIGDKALIKEGHMPGMEGAEATIVGAYLTRAYVVSYTPTNGGPIENNHKWVIQEEILNVGEATLNKGTEVILDADHMVGMKGAKAIIEGVEETTVYMVDFTLTTTKEQVENHKWVTESELSTLINSR